MRKALLLLTLLAFTFIGQAQTKPPELKTKADTLAFVDTAMHDFHEYISNADLNNFLRELEDKLTVKQYHEIVNVLKQAINPAYKRLEATLENRKKKYKK